MSKDQNPDIPGLKFPTFPGADVLCLTSRQQKYLDKLVESGDVVEARKFSGSAHDEVQRWFEWKPFSDHVTEKMRQVACSRGMTRELLFTMAHDLLTGKTKMDKAKLHVWSKMIDVMVALSKPISNPKEIKSASSFGQWDVVTKPVGAITNQSDEHQTC